MLLGKVPQALCHCYNAHRENPPMSCCLLLWCLIGEVSEDL